MKQYTILLDSSANMLSIGLSKDKDLIDTINYEAWQRQSEYMVKELDNLLKKHNIKKEEIKDLIVGIGPGSYTGVRISLTIAKVMSLALNIPIYPISSLRILSFIDDKTICLMNARSNRSYIGVYDKHEIILEDRIMNNDDILTYINENKNYKIAGECKYLNLGEKCENIFLRMLDLKETLTMTINPDLVKPMYLKD